MSTSATGTLMAKLSYTRQEGAATANTGKRLVCSGSHIVSVLSLSPVLLNSGPPRVLKGVGSLVD